MVLNRIIYVDSLYTYLIPYFTFITIIVLRHLMFPHTYLLLPNSSIHPISKILSLIFTFRFNLSFTIDPCFVFCLFDS